MVLESWWRYASGCQQEPTKHHEVASSNFFSTPCRSQAAPVPGRRWASWCEAPTSWWLRRRSVPSTMPSVSFAALSKRGQLPQQKQAFTRYTLGGFGPLTKALLHWLVLQERNKQRESHVWMLATHSVPAVWAAWSASTPTHTHYTHNESTNRCLLIQQPHPLVICICTYWAFLLFFSGWCFTHQGSDCWRWRSRNWACCASGWVLTHTGWYGGLLRTGIQWRTWSNSFNSGWKRRPEPHFHRDWAPQQACSRRQDGRH